MIGSWRIFLYDIKKIATNWVAAILIIGLTILPSLYAWFNIKASWDPYGQTNQIPVGIVNEDKGAIVRGHEIHVGDELVSTLKEKKSMDWKFVNREIAMEKLEYGDYFSVLIIPEDFSERLATVISDDPKKADVDYYVNEKINAIAPKITEKGASVIVEQISSKFISTVNGIIFEIFNDLGIELEENLPDIKKFEDYIFILEEKLPEIQGIINDTIVDAEKADNLITQAQGLMPEIEEATASGLQTIDNTTRILQEAEDRLAVVSPKIDEYLTKAHNTSSQINEFVNSIDPSTIDLSEGNQISNKLIGQINDTLQSISIIKNNLNQIQKVNNPNDESFNDQG
ncbi:MAG TPA: YhgE/Pip domain-containing protein, partial [Ureibacillus sp.]|nr:YhgE/Pip domain-containing protein [Ureibacillus sp.]